MENTSARNMWGDYLDKHLEDAFHNAPEVVHFYDNEEDANSCADLAKKGIKRATTDSLLGLQLRNEALPKIGDFKVVTNWQGEAQCIIKVTKVKLKPYFSIDQSYVELEGEGDRSLPSWKKNHWDYYTRELEPFDRKPNESMIVVCQEFEKIF